MKEIKRVYLDTSVISALFDSRAPERQNLTQIFWNSLKKYDVNISQKVLEELSDSPEPLREKLLNIVKNFHVLTITEESEDLAREYVKSGIFPEKYYDDVLHVALASVNDIGYLLSWNFGHLVKVKTRRLVSLVNASKEYPPVEIIAPPEL